LISVCEWQPGYGDPHALEDDEGFARVWEHAQLQAVEVPPSVRLRQTEDSPGLLPLAFVDGVRRGEAIIYLPAATALAGVLAAGAALPGGGYVEVRVVRVFLRVEDIDLPPQPGGFSWKSLPLSPDTTAEISLQRAMREAESEVGRRMLAQGYTVIMDGPLAAGLSGKCVGYVKTQHRLLLEPDQAQGLLSLGPGQRSSFFGWGSKHGTYVRLGARESYQHPYHNLIRLEAVGEARSCAALLHQAAGTIGQFAGVSHLDPRAPQNLQPIAGLEKELRRRSGDSGLAYRAVRQAVAQLRKSVEEAE